LEFVSLEAFFPANETLRPVFFFLPLADAVALLLASRPSNADDFFDVVLDFVVLGALDFAAMEVPDRRILFGFVPSPFTFLHPSKSSLPSYPPTT
jgi:hypothetical protein